MSRVIIRDAATRQRAIDLINALSPDKVWDVTVSLHKSKRSLEQNRLYHLWVGIIAEATGTSHDVTHESLKAEFLPPIISEMAGKVYEVRPSTTALKVPEMSVFLNQIEAWAGTMLGIALPNPADLGR